MVLAPVELPALIDSWGTLKKRRLRLIIVSCFNGERYKLFKSVLMSIENLYYLLFGRIKR
jgi:hypothetical protein